MESLRSSNFRGKVYGLFVGIGLVFPLGNYAALSSVEDTLMTTHGTAGSNRFNTIFHLGANGVAHGIVGTVSGGINEVRDSLETSYVYGPPTADEPNIATFQTGGGAQVQLRFDEGDSKSATEISFYSPTSYSFFTRESLTGALNVSNRIVLHPGERNITGTVIAQPSWVLIRGIGPSLLQFGVENPVSDVSIALYRGAKRIDSNDQWGTDGPDAQGLTWVFELAGAFLLEEGTNDAALFTQIGKGAITVHVTSGNAAEAGEALVEVYILPYR